MKKCTYCESTILFDSVKVNDSYYCDKKCAEEGHLYNLSFQIPEEHVLQKVREIHQGSCEKCNSNGSVDLHRSYYIRSFIYTSELGINQQFSCQSCGKKSKALEALKSFLLGWWSFPIGVYVTPFQVLKNIYAIFFL